MKLDASYWTERYENQKTGWDIGYSGPLSQILDLIKDKEVRILIPGCGSGYEAEYAFQNGFKNIHVLDFSQEPLEAFKKRCPEFPTSQIHQDDFFKHKGTYDVVLEQTFFCALNPELRENYADKMHDLLSPNGILSGVLFDFPLDSGPPFGGTKENYIQLFSRKFEIEKMEHCTFSIKPRAGKELYVKFRKKKDDRG